MDVAVLDHLQMVMQLVRRQSSVSGPMGTLFLLFFLSLASVFCVAPFRSIPMLKIGAVFDFRARTSIRRC